MKKCFKCGEAKKLAEFYRHKAMADGHLNKCKACAKIDAGAHRLENLEKIRAYDRRRGNRQSKEYLDKYRIKFPMKYKAKTMVNNSVRDGKLFSEPCEICGTEKTVAHHDNYAKPLNVRWLCQAHHKQWHAKHGAGLNGS